MPEQNIGREFDLQPHPRILPMLGEINLDQWRCLAELIDNAIDGFLNSQRAGKLIALPEVHITLPVTDGLGAKITVRDNGPGMDRETLENAVRAGWTGNDPIGNLGMFGMGFNIATARLGMVTRVWTTREGDGEWNGLEIDLDTLIRQRHFRTPMLTRPKTDPYEQGTEISIERLKPEQRQWLAKSGSRSKVVKQLGLTYSAMLRTNGLPISFRLLVNGPIVPGRDHCVWGGEDNPVREVPTARSGIVNAQQGIDVRLPDRPFCVKCWQWLAAGEKLCPACSSSENVVQRQRRVRGWLGIQRYLGSSDYGIDFLRHGRKIEIGNRDLFFWNGDGIQDEEYPIDDPRHRGRIVGEIHLDHCRVTYTKDRFDRNDLAWEEMIRLVRGEGPLRPDKAQQAGYGPNTSPLSLLFQAFRRSSPKPKVAGCYAKLLLVPDNERAEEMAKRFYARETDYQTDAKWWELVEEADRNLLVPPQLPSNAGIQDSLEGWPSPELPTVTEAAPSAPPVPARRVPISSLTREYRDSITELRWNVLAYDVDSTDPTVVSGRLPWKLEATPAGTFQFFISTQHPMFRSATMTPLDGLLAELAYRAVDFQRGTTNAASFASILSSLRDTYAGAVKLDAVTLSAESSSTLSMIARSLSRNVAPEDSLALFSELTPAEQEAIQQKMATRSVPNPQQIISGGRFLEFAPRKTLLQFFGTHPELFFDGRYWDTAYDTLDYGRPAATEEAQSQVVRYYASLLTDAIWLAEQDPTDLAAASRPRLLRAAMALELLSAAPLEDE